MIPTRCIAGLSISVLAACASGTKPPAQAPVSTTTTTSAELPMPMRPALAVVREDAQAHGQPTKEPDYTAEETENANQVLETIEPDLLACYRARVAVRPEAHGFITADILIGPDGHVRRVETTGGAPLGDSAMKCIVHRIERASFEPPHGGGTLHIHVPFAFRRVTPGEEP